MEGVKKPAAAHIGVVKKYRSGVARLAEQAPQRLRASCFAGRGGYGHYGWVRPTGSDAGGGAPSAI